jgi:hypothetical protein
MTKEAKICNNKCKRKYLDRLASLKTDGSFPATVESIYNEDVVNDQSMIET